MFLLKIFIFLILFKDSYKTRCREILQETSHKKKKSIRNGQISNTFYQKEKISQTHETNSPRKNVFTKNVSFSYSIQRFL